MAPAIGSIHLITLHGSLVLLESLIPPGRLLMFLTQDSIGILIVNAQFDSCFDSNANGRLASTPREGVTDGPSDLPLYNVGGRLYESGAI